MIDVVIVIAVPDEVDSATGQTINPAHSKVFRYEFETLKDAEDAIKYLGGRAVDGGQMFNQGYM